jgi:hypothetical protein
VGGGGEKRGWVGFEFTDEEGRSNKEAPDLRDEGQGGGGQREEGGGRGGGEGGGVGGGSGGVPRWRPIARSRRPVLRPRGGATAASSLSSNASSELPPSSACHAAPPPPRKCSVSSGGTCSSGCGSVAAPAGESWDRISCGSIPPRSNSSTMALTVPGTGLYSSSVRTIASTAAPLERTSAMTFRSRSMSATHASSCPSSAAASSSASTLVRSTSPLSGPPSGHLSMSTSNVVRSASLVVTALTPIRPPIASAGWSASAMGVDKLCSTNSTDPTPRASSYGVVIRSGSHKRRPGATFGCVPFGDMTSS